MATPRFDQLAHLFHHRWAVPVLAELHRQQGSKFVTLVHRLGASRGAMRQAIDALLERGLVMRNPGYGHPLRPEYILTPEGAAIAPACLALYTALKKLRLESVGLRKWSLAVLGAIRAGSDRFGALRASLPTITDRALTLTLKDLAEAGLVERLVLDEYPPRAAYAPTALARPLLRQIKSLV